MQRTWRSWAGASQPLLRLTVVGLSAVIFVIDTVTDLEIAVAVFYIAIVLLSIRAFDQRGVKLVSLSCICLTLLSFFLTRTGAAQAGLVNCIISLSAIAVTTYLSLRIVSAEVAIRDAREQLAHSARIAALGELTTSIAHEVNQPLAAIATSASASIRWLSAQSPNLDKARRAIDRVIADAHRASAVVERVSSLAKRAAPRNDPVDVNEAIRDVLELTRGELEEHNIAWEAKLAEDLPRLRGDRIQLQQVILNLIINAIEAMGGEDSEPRYLVVRSEKADRGQIQVTVADSGQGLDQKNIEELFDAFYTTKPDGIGIGLAISRTIVSAHGGRIWATANAPRGACFQFRLPTNTAEFA